MTRAEKSRSATKTRKRESGNVAVCKPAVLAPASGSACWRSATTPRPLATKHAGPESTHRAVAVVDRRADCMRLMASGRGELGSCPVRRGASEAKAMSQRHGPAHAPLSALVLSCFRGTPILAIALLLALLARPVLADPPAPPTAQAQATCVDPAVTTRLAALVHGRRFADAHHAATDLRVQCGDQLAWHVLDDIALLRL